MANIEKQDKEEILEKISEEEYEEALKGLGEVYMNIIEILKRYIDLDERYYNIISLWIIGTYMHKEFITYPYLFFNAMKGSGKTRTLHLISKLMKRGKLQSNVTEAVLFRTAEQFGFCIDEIERIGSKEKAPLKELLNTAYKKGMHIERVKKKKVDGEEQYVLETHRVYTPICMANIWGMDDVLGDRSITIVLERSPNYTITKAIENFDFDEGITQAKEQLVGVVGVVITRKKVYNILREWNDRIHHLYNIYNNTTPNNTTTPNNPINKGNSSSKLIIETALNDTQNNTDLEFFEKVVNTEIDGRNLELFLPLFIIANLLGNHILDKTIKSALEIVHEKKEEDVMENKDIILIDFIARMRENKNFIPLKQILYEFKDFLQEDEDMDKKWKVNSKWLGKALKRLKLIIRKRRLRIGVEVKLDFMRARKQIQMFKEIPKEDLEEPGMMEPKTEENKKGLDN